MLSWYVARFVAQTLHLPDFTFTVDNKAIITLEGKSYWTIFPLQSGFCVQPVSRVSLDIFFEIHTLTPAERKTFQCHEETFTLLEYRLNGSENCAVALY